MVAIVFCLASFALMLLMYGIFRTEIMNHVPASILIGTVWNFRKSLPNSLTNIAPYDLLIFMHAKWVLLQSHLWRLQLLQSKLRFLQLFHIHLIRC